MRKLIVGTFLTLDGVMQAPGGPGEDDSGGFAHGGWSVNYWDERMGEIMGESMSKPFDLVLGRKTYEIFAAHWPHATDDPGAKPALHLLEGIGRDLRAERCQQLLLLAVAEFFQQVRELGGAKATERLG